MRLCLCAHASVNKCGYVYVCMCVGVVEIISVCVHACVSECGCVYVCVRGGWEGRERGTQSRTD